MARYALVVLSLLVAAPGLGGSRPKAMVKSYGDFRRLASESVPCGVMLEGLLRERGFEVIERTLPESQAGLVVTVHAGCSRVWGRPQSTYHDIRNPESDCSVYATVEVRGRTLHYLDASGSSNTGHLQAISAACHELADKLDHVLGTGPRSEPAAEAKDERLEVVLRWQGELSPMPLLVATRFFEKAGYQAELEQGGPDRCAFSVRSGEGPERLGYLLKTYLQAEYAVRLTRSDPTGLELTLAPRPE